MTAWFKFPAAFLFACLVAFAQQAQAKDLLPGIIGADDRKIVDSKQYPWTAIGRVNIAGFKRRGVCTGTLIGPRTVVTAAHCLYNGWTFKPVVNDQVHFLPGFERGEFTAHGRAQCIRFVGNFTYSKKPKISDLKEDIAVIILQEPIDIDPVGLHGAGELERGQELSYAGYGRDRPFLLSAHEKCTFRGKRHGLWLTDCDSNSGGSGGPVLIEENGEPRMVGILAGVVQRTYSLVVPVARWGDLTSLRCEVPE